MTFNQFVLEAAKERALRHDHRPDACASVMGLAGETADLFDITTEWMRQPELPPARRLIRKLGYLEHHRALAYVELARVPERVLAPSVTATPNVRDAVAAMTIEAGRLLLLVRNGVFHDQWAHNQVDLALRRFDEARLAFYREFDFTPEDIWLAHTAAREAIQQLVNVERPATAAHTGRRSTVQLTAIMGGR